MPWTHQTHTGYQPQNTSLEAALHVGPSAPLIRSKIINFLRQTGRAWTSEEIACHLDLDYRSVQPRLSELRDEGKTRDSGVRRLSSRNRNTIAWEAAPK